MKARSHLALVFGLLVTVACGRTVPGDEPRGIMASSIWIDKAPDGDVGQFNSLAADSEGRPHVSYYDYTSGALKYARLDGARGTWVTEIVDQEGDVGLYTSIAIDSQNNPHIVYYDVSGDRMKYAYFNGVEWQRASLFDHGGLFASLTLDANDVAHIAFIDRQSYDLIYMRWDVLTSGTAPVWGVIDTGTLTGPSGIGGNLHGGISIQVRPETQQPIVAYYHASLGSLLVMAKMPGHPAAGQGGLPQEWMQWVVDGSTVIGQGNDDVGEHTSLFVNGENEWHVSYYDKTNEDLKYARWDDEGQRWLTERVDSDGLVGEASSITVVCRQDPKTRTRDCRPYISYFDSTNNDLKVATRRGDLPWQTFRADLSGMTGTYTSIAEVANGRVGISYRDFTYSGLKFLLLLPF